MNSCRAAALRWILPLLPLFATVDFFGTEDFVAFVDAVLLFGVDGFDKVDDRLDEERVDELFPVCAVSDIGKSSAMAASRIPMRLSITNLSGFT